MVEHIVWFKLRAQAPEADKQRLMAELVALKERIPGIIEASAGADYSGRAAGYTHGFVARFVDRAALEAYHPHPAHRTVVERYVEPISEGVLALDFEHD
ncbi:MAG: Dabb family protein [Proteobacteria bacterium]|nr:Dabb family protein [Pseudomonadota bacterium]